MKPLATHQLGESENRALDLMIVDESRLQRRILQSNLASAGYTVRCAGSADEAFAMCIQRRPDIVISDWIMPGRSGLDLCSDLRGKFIEDYVYFIVLTSKDEKQEVAKALNMGADDILSKPVSGHELLARILAGRRLLNITSELREKNALISQTLDQMKRLNARLDHDLEEARHLQTSLAPSEPVEIGAFRTHFLLEPSGHVGGDLVGCFPLSGDKVGLYALDVSGHGIAAALVTARLSSWFSGATPEHNVALTDGGAEPEMRPPHEICETMNRRFLRELDTELYFTLFVACLDTATGRLTYAQAGHPHPALQRASGDVRFIGTGGPPIGLLDDMEFETSETVIEPGDRVLIYSDGVTECPDPGGAMLDEAGLSRFLDLHSGSSGSALLDALSKQLHARTAGHDLDDDVSAILIERVPIEDTR